MELKEDPNFSQLLDKISVTEMEQKDEKQEENKNDCSQKNQLMEQYFNKLMGTQQQMPNMIYKWSYSVKKGDDNYDLRTDTVNDYFDFDSDQNFQIELHYQECCSGKKKFGDKHLIVGDMFGVQKIGKNGKYKYHVWGTSEDSATWFEQNCTIKGAPVRKLSRTIIFV